MNIQKIQTSTKGFTLVELIVVITILVILGTIAFLNLGGFSASARDSQRTSDLNQINQQVMTMQTKSAIPYLSMVSGTGNAIPTATAFLAGAAGTTSSDYNAGDANYTVLGVDKNKFQDPVSGVAYKMGATTRAGTSYELAAKLEETSTALVIGTFKARGTGATDISTADATIDGAALKNIVLGNADIGKFKVGDTLATVAGCTTPKISAISTDLKTLTVESACTAGTITAGAVKLANPDIAGLIGSGSSAVTNKGIVLPY